MQEQLAGVIGEMLHRTVVFLREAMQERFQERQNILGTLPERRNLNKHGAEPVIQILSKSSGAHFMSQVLVRGHHDAHIGLAHLRSPYARELTGLQYTKKTHLCSGRHFADLVQENGAAIRLLEVPDAALDRSRVRSFLGAEQLRLDEALRDGAAVDDGERLAPPGAKSVDRLCDKLLARAAFPLNEHGDIGPGHLPHAINDVSQRHRPADNPKALLYRFPVHLAMRRQMRQIQTRSYGRAGRQAAWRTCTR